MRFEYNRKYVIVIVAFIVLFSLIFLFKTFKSTMTTKFSSKMMPTATLITAEPVKEIVWEPEIRTIGSVRAERAVDIAPEVSGRVTSIAFSSGEKVEKGALLVQLNPDVLTADLANAMANYRFLTVSYDRQRELYAHNAGQKQALDSSEAEMEKAKAAVEKIQAQLKQLAISAPFSGVLGLRYVDIGQYVSAGTVLVNLQSINPMEVDFTVPEVLLHTVTVGLPVTVSSLAYRDEPVKGKIVAVNSHIEPTSRMLVVRASVDNEKLHLIPDMFVDVVVHLGGGKSVMIVPQMAINYSQVGDYVYVVIDSKAVKKYVHVGERRDNIIVVESGITPKDIVITTGQLKLQEGAAVEIANPDVNNAEQKTT